MLGILRRLRLISPLPEHYLAESLRLYPDQWKFDRHYATHSPTGVKLWVSSGVHNIEVVEYGEGGDKVSLEFHVQEQVWAQVQIYLRRREEITRREVERRVRYGDHPSGET